MDKLYQVQLLKNKGESTCQLSRQTQIEMLA
ncbi:hypothetical protein NOS3756_60030 (plasmid) [Nostoc sp. NIES-3756]|nr:hypothetical protein NOS3756_60030 [Nostoc sp. NIES-3756]